MTDAVINIDSTMQIEFKIKIEPQNLLLHYTWNQHVTLKCGKSIFPFTNYLVALLPLSPYLRFSSLMLTAFISAYIRHTYTIIAFINWKNCVSWSHRLRMNLECPQFMCEYSLRCSTYHCRLVCINHQFKFQKQPKQDTSSTNWS